jgi:hypothetical protein
MNTNLGTPCPKSGFNASKTIVAVAVGFAGYAAVNLVREVAANGTAGAGFTAKVLLLAVSIAIVSMAAGFHLLANMGNPTPVAPTAPLRTVSAPRVIGLAALAFIGLSACAAPGAQSNDGPVPAASNIFVADVAHNIAPNIVAAADVASIEPAVETPAPVVEAAAPVVDDNAYGCDAAMAYLQANAEPSFQLVCGAYAFGGQAVTCYFHAPQCANSAVIIINVPCAIAYKNEAANSWTLKNHTGAKIDPFGPSC